MTSLKLFCTLAFEFIFFPLVSRGLLGSSVRLWTGQKWLQCGSSQKCAADTWGGSATVVHPCFHKASKNCIIALDLFMFFTPALTAPTMSI